MPPPDSPADRYAFPEKGRDWDSLQKELKELGKGDVDWRSARTAVYVFNAGEDVLNVAKQAYANRGVFGARSRPFWSFAIDSRHRRQNGDRSPL